MCRVFLHVMMKRLHTIFGDGIKLSWLWRVKAPRSMENGRDRVFLFSFAARVIPMVMIVFRLDDWLAYIARPLRQSFLGAV